MDTQGFVAGPLSVLCIIALVVGTASAAVITASDGTTGCNTGSVHQHQSPESIINSLAEKGVDVTEVKTALQNGDTETVKAWLEAHRPARPEGSGHAPRDLSNATCQQEIITRLEGEGVDVSSVETSLSNGDSAAVQTWLETYSKEHRPARSVPDLTNSTQQQRILTKLEAEGVDVTEAKTALQNGDTSAVQTWLEAYFQAHRQERPDGSGRSPPDLTNSTRQQQIVTRLEEQGVDVTEVEADLQNGDTTAVQTWLETYLHSHEGEMSFHHHFGEHPVMSQTDISG